MSDNGIFKVHLRMKETHEGGREGPTPPGMFRTIIKHRTGNFSCGVFVGDDICLKPGGDYDAEVLVLHEEDRAGFQLGDEIEFWEGKTIAAGKVTETT
jgi:hypothetical protein